MRAVRGCQTMVLVGLVSSGKSTLVNALVGRPVMPTDNLACTAMTVTVVDPLKDGAFPPAAYVDGGQFTVIDGADAASALWERNQSGTGGFYLRAPLTKLNHGLFPAAIVDTPGVNDGMNDACRHTAVDALRAIPDPTVVFVSHVRTCEQTDEQRCLQGLAEVMREKGINEWFVALNGWNFMDPEKNEQDRYREKVCRMAEMCGLPCPKVFFVAALPAQLCMQAMSGGQLSKKDWYDLEEYLADYDLLSKAKQNRRTLGRISNRTLRTAFYRCGVTSLERGLFEHLNRKRKGREGA